MRARTVNKHGTGVTDIKTGVTNYEQGHFQFLVYTSLFSEQKRGMKQKVDFIYSKRSPLLGQNIIKSLNNLLIMNF